MHMEDSEKHSSLSSTDLSLIFESPSQVCLFWGVLACCFGCGRAGEIDKGVSCLTTDLKGPGRVKQRKRGGRS